MIQVAYALWLKEQPVIDLAIVSAGFLLRAIAGGVAVDVPLSQWFLLVASFGSLFMVAGKRYSELRSLGNEAGTRRTLEEYSVSYLRFVWSLAAAVTITAYSLWAFEIRNDSGVDWQAISIAPFVMGLLRYAVDIDRGLAGEPEEAVMRDRVLQVIAVSWLTIFAIGVYSTVTESLDRLGRYELPAPPASPAPPTSRRSVTSSRRSANAASSPAAWAAATAIRRRTPAARCST